MYLPAVNIAIPRHHIRHVVTWITLDAVILLGAYISVYSARMLDFSSTEIIRIIPAASAATLAMLSSLYLAGVYHQIWLHTSGHRAGLIVNAGFVATVATLIVDTFLYPRPLPLSVIIIANALAVSGFVALRFRHQLAVVQYWKRSSRSVAQSKGTNVLIIGAGEAGQILALQMKRQSHRDNYNVVGFVDDDPHKQGLFIEGLSVLGDRQAIPHVVDRQGISLIVLAIHNISGHDFRDILSYCEKTNARIKVIPDLFGIIETQHNTPLLRDIRAEDLIGRSVVRPNKAVNLDPVMQKTILVTGAAGSIGSELCRQLPQYNPSRIIMLDNNESGLHDLVTEVSARFPDIEIVPVLADITIRESLAAVFRKHTIQIVFHAAAYKHVPLLQYYPNEVVRVNIGGTRNLAELARDHGVSRFVLISTDKAVDPANVMGASKRICELIVQSLAREGRHQTLFTTVRFGNVLGSRGSVLPTFERQIDSGGPVTVTHPEMNRYFMSIPEAVNLVIHAACLTEGGDIFLLRMGDVVRIVELAERMIRLRGLRPYQDIAIRFTGVRPGEKLNEELHTTGEHPLDTAHPGIIKLVSDLQPEVDMLNTRVNTLLQNGISEGDDALVRLRHVIYGDQQPDQRERSSAAD